MRLLFGVLPLLAQCLRLCWGWWLQCNCPTGNFTEFRAKLGSVGQIRSQFFTKIVGSSLKFCKLTVEMKLLASIVYITFQLEGWKSSHFAILLLAARRTAKQDELWPSYIFEEGCRGMNTNTLLVFVILAKATAQSLVLGRRPLCTVMTCAW